MNFEKPKCAECLVSIGYPHEPTCELKGIVTKQECGTHFEMYCEECKATEGRNHLPGCSWAADGRVGERRKPERLLEVGGPVVHPKHYNQHPAGIECIDVIEHMTLNIGNAVKYVWRAGLKVDSSHMASGDAGVTAAEVQDLHKAIWYIQREIERIEQPFTMRKGPKAKS